MLNKEYQRYYRKTKKGVLRTKYNDMRRRSLKEKHKNIPREDLCTRNEFYNFALKSEKFDKLYNQWKESGYQRKLHPSVDRVNNNKGYCLDNIQFITLSDNGIKAGLLNEREGRNGIKVKIIKNGKEVIFNKSVQASEYLGVVKSAMGEAVRRNFKLKGWKIEYLEKVV